MDEWGGGGGGGGGREREREMERRECVSTPKREADEKDSVAQRDKDRDRHDIVDNTQTHTHHLLHTLIHTKMREKALTWGRVYSCHICDMLCEENLEYTYINARSSMCT